MAADEGGVLRLPGRGDTLPQPTPEEAAARRERADQWKPIAAELATAFDEGKSSPVYLATLAKAYAFLSTGGTRMEGARRMSIANAIDRKTNTAKMHLVEARKEGYLTDSGEMTDKARQVLSK
ncbi:hypothetical protein ACIQU4_10355 [Streptomyces sp. NPDC090741]|uniref:hypothetical protein n=1 Tax=Streptomyces sp. NPDC090741 TaxID=3365967 RepID=UPI0037F9DB6E